METQETLSELADSLIDAYWILCEPADVVGRVIDEFAEYKRNGRPYTYNDEVVTAEELLMALDEVVCYFQGRKIWPVEDATATALAKAGTKAKLRRATRHLRRPRRKGSDE